jgi:putative tricarboxylic transport membrane protein
MWLEGFLNALSLHSLIWLAFGTAIGLIIGVLPALGPAFGVALMLPFTFGMDPAAAIIFLVAIHASCNYGDSVASIMINVPGGPGTVATCWDGYPLAQQGKGGTALGIATFSSFFGGVGTWLFLLFFLNPIKKFAFAIGSPEYFALGIMALGLVSVASRGETIKGLIMACFGLALSTVGQDQATGLTYRFSYGILWLEGGIPIVVAALGLFALSQVIVLLDEGGTIAEVGEVKGGFLSGLKEVIRRPITLLRSGMVGWFVGILPAMGVAVAGIASYFVEKKYSRESEQFGKGAPAGVAAAEVGKGACVVGDLIPTFTLGVPGSVTGAILLAALVIQGIEPGPNFLMSGALPYTVFAGIVLAQASFLLSGLAFSKIFVLVVKCPNVILAPLITVLTFLGSLAQRNNPYDIPVTVLFGIFSFAMGKLRYPVVCLILGLILGPIVESNFHQSLGIAYGSYSIFITRPIAVALLVITILFLIGPYMMDIIRTFLGKRIVSEKKTHSSPSVPKEDLILLLFFALVFAGFFITARTYSPRSRLFPDLVCIVGLIFVLWRFLAIVKHIRYGGFGWILGGTTLFAGRISWQWFLLTAVGFIIAMHILSFFVATALYLASVMFLSGGQRWRRIVSVSILSAIAVYIFSNIVYLQLPLGVFEIFF